ncbi:MAG: dTDP-4-dehydrorhamnose 3,5-epimerase family protein [Actinomycetes bacterium]
MRFRELGIPDAYELTPVQHGDDRGVFLEWFVRDSFEKETGHSLGLAQANCSVSSRGVVRGIHYADVPPGQAKYVACLAGAALDVVVDLRTGSPTFGCWEAVRLDDVGRRVVYIAEGLGHAFVALSDRATMTYLCSEQYNPDREHGVHPLDPDIGIAWPEGVGALMSPRDAEANGLREAEAAGLLPEYDACLELYEAKRTVSAG